MGGVRQRRRSRSGCPGVWLVLLPVKHTTGWWNLRYRSKWISGVREEDPQHWSEVRRQFFRLVCLYNRDRYWECIEDDQLNYRRWGVRSPQVEVFLRSRWAKARRPLFVILGLLFRSNERVLTNFPTVKNLYSDGCCEWQNNCQYQEEGPKS